MNGRIAFLAVLAALLLGGLVWGLKAGQRAISQAQQETRQKIGQAVQEAQSKAEAAALDAERQAQAQDDSKPASTSATKNADDPILVKSITIDGLEKAGLSEKDLADIEIQMDDRPVALGRPTADKVRMGSLMRPVSPLTLYRTETNRMATAVVEMVNARGFVGVYVQAAETEGDQLWHLYLAVVDKVDVEDHRSVKEPPADLEAIRAECPVKIGEHLLKPRLDEFAKTLRRRFPDGANITVSSGQEFEHVELIIVLGHPQSK